MTHIYHSGENACTENDFEAFRIAKEKGVILDAGANVDCRPEFLLQFAHMGAIYAENVLGIKNKY